YRFTRFPFVDTCIEDITAPSHIADILPRLGSERLTHFLDAFDERAIGHGTSMPHLFDQSVFADEVALVFDQVLKYFERLRAQVNGLSSPHDATARQVERESVEKIDPLTVVQSHPS